MKQKTLLKQLLFLCLLVVGGVNSAFAAEVAYKTITFNSLNNSGGVSSYTASWSATQDGFTCNLQNWNNNNNGWNLIKAGRKNSTSVATITTNATIDKAIDSVVVTVDAVSTSYINSTKLEVATNSAFTENKQEITVGAATGRLNYTITTPTTNCYYRLTYDCKSGTSNGLITVSKVEFYKSPDVIAVTGVTLNKTSTSIGVGGTETLTATVAPAEATNKTVSWSSSDVSVATVSNGVVTGVSAGVSTITATTEDGSFTATCTVTVTAPIAVTGVTLNKPSTTIIVGNTETLTATVVPAEATNKTVSWTSSDESVATVSDGVVTAVAVGSATITVTTADGGKTATCAVTVAPIPTHYATFYVNGSQLSQTIVQEGAAITFPAEDPADSNGKKFQGWATATIDGTTNTKPDFVTEVLMSTSDLNFYAVFATVGSSEIEGSSEITAETTNFPSSYAALAEYTLNGKKYKIKQGYKNVTKLQWRSSDHANGAGTMYNTDTFDKIKSVVLTYDGSDGNRNFTLTVGTSENPTSGTNITPTNSNNVYTFDCSTSTYTHFVLTNGTGAGYLTKITIYYATISQTISAYCTDTRDAAPISYAVTSVDKLVSDANFTNELTNTQSLAVTYGSSNTSVATVNSTTGEVDILGVGSTTITASYAETSLYLANTASYTLNVTAKALAGLAYETEAVEKLTTDAAFTNTLTNPNSLTVSYTSSNTSVATVDENGEVTIVGVGSTTITAASAETAIYEAGNATFTLNVVKDNPTLTFVNSNVEVGLTDGTYTQAVTTTPAELPVTYTSSDETVGIVASDGTVTLLKAGSTTITATFAGNASYNAANISYTLTVAINYATLPFSFNSGRSGIGTTLTDGITGLMQSGLDSDYSVTNTKLKFDGTDDYVVLKIAEVPGTLSFSIKGNGYSSGSTSTFKVQTSVDGESYTDIATYTELGDEATKTFDIAGNVRYIKWIYTEKGNNSGGNVGLGNISLTKTNTLTLAEACTDGEKYYGTYSLGKAFVVPADLTVSAVSVAGGKLTVTDYLTGDVVKANTGVLVSAATAGAKTVTVSDETGTELDGNMLKASGDAELTAVNMDEDNTLFYRLTMHNGTDLGFWWGAAEGAAFALAKNKAYLAVPEAQAARIQGFWFDDDAAGIAQIENGTMKTEDSVYNLNGQRVQSAKKGLYIKNGKKIVVK